MDPTSFNKRKQQEALETRKAEIVAAVARFEAKGKGLPAQISPIQAMDFVEEAIGVCGGEKKVQFLDVSRTFIKVFTRVPMTANLFQFLPEADDNPRFHKVMSKILISQGFVQEIRWLPHTEGAVLLVLLTE